MMALSGQDGGGHNKNCFPFGLFFAVPVVYLSSWVLTYAIASMQERERDRMWV